MKHIGIDARLYFQTGVGTYLRNFLHFLPQYISKNTRISLFVLQEDADSIAHNHPDFSVVPVSARWHSMNEQITLYATLMRANLDLMHFTYFSYPVLYKRPFIATVHDVTPIQFKTGKASTKNSLIYNVKYAAFKYVLEEQVKHAAAIVTPTHTIKKHLVDLYGSQFEKKIYPYYEGVDFEFGMVKENVSMGERYKAPFFLYVGNFYPHKNVERLIKAFAVVPEPYTLLLCGPEDYFSQHIKEYIASQNLQKKVLFHPNPKREDLMYCYKHAVALVHPSLSEGFGLPLIEAMQFNLPIIASDIDVFKELLQSSFTPFDPFKVEHIAEVLREAVNGKKKVNYDHLLPQYSFETMTKQISALYTRLLS